MIGETPTYGYRRVWAVLRRAAWAQGLQPPNHKRIYRIMKAHGLLLNRHAGGSDERRHDGRIAVDRSNFVGARMASNWAATMARRFGSHSRSIAATGRPWALSPPPKASRARTFGISWSQRWNIGSARSIALPETIEWLTDNGSGYIAHDTRRFARDIGFEPRTTPVESPQSNGMAEAFVRTIKRDYARVSPAPNAETVMRSLPHWFEHYNTVHPHRALGYRSPREFIASRLNRENMSGL